MTFAPAVKESFMVLSILLWAGLAVLIVGFVSVAFPLRFLGISKRSAGAVVAVTGIALVAIALAWPLSSDHQASRSARIDEFMPVWQVSERHTIHIAASPGRVFEAVRGVRADEIALFNLLTAIRRGGRRGPEGILNATGQKPLLEVATHSGFMMLADDVPRELVIGLVMTAPKDFRENHRLTPEVFKARLPPRVALATMNFLATPDDRGGTELSTETRVYATDRASLRAFTVYWRIIAPGSDIIRRMWLRAIRDRAERATDRSQASDKIVRRQSTGMSAL